MVALTNHNNKFTHCNGKLCSTFLKFQFKVANCCSIAWSVVIVVVVSDARVYVEM